MIGVKEPRVLAAATMPEVRQLIDEETILQRTAGDGLDFQSAPYVASAQRTTASMPSTGRLE
jgi:hypothetical protein